MPQPWRSSACGGLAILLTALFACRGGPAAQSERLVREVEAIGARPGGGLVVAQRSEPTSFNPVAALDEATRFVLRLITGELVSIDAVSQHPVPALAESWTIAGDGRTFHVQLRRGVRFSDGHEFDAGDVVFTFQVHQDEKVGSPVRDLLLVGGAPVEVQRLGSHALRFHLKAPYAPGVRLLQGIAILPEHALADDYRAGRIAAAWDLATPLDRIPSLGPFVPRRFLPGERLILERNPNYWKTDPKGRRLPHLDRVTVLFVRDQSAQVARFLAGETDVISPLAAKDFPLVERGVRGRVETHDLGPSLSYTFLLLNQNSDVPGAVLRRKQEWFRMPEFRRAISLAADRRAIAELAYRRRATPIASPVSPGNHLWYSGDVLPRPASALEARRLLQAAGFSWNAEGRLLDPRKSEVEFSIVTSSANEEWVGIGAILQADLAPLGIKVGVTPVEYRGLLDRVLRSYDYEAAILALGPSDVDPVSEMNVWLSSGRTNLWNLSSGAPNTAWEAEVDRLMRQQLVELDPGRRKQRYAHLQRTLAEHLPMIFLVSPHLLAAAKSGLRNFRPAILSRDSLWNIEELYWSESR